MIMRTMLRTIVLGLSLSAACGGGSNAPSAPLGGGDGAGGDGNGGEQDAGVLFPDDKAGPVITFTSPVVSNGAAPIVGGTVVVSMTIKDTPAGVARSDDKLYASIETGGKDVRYEVVPHGDEFSVTFQAEDFDSTADVTLVVHAEDTTGNVSTASHLMLLDTIPPWLSFDPSDVRVGEVSKGMVNNCSAPFDPLGLSPRDGEVVLQETRFRAFVWERTLHFPGATEDFFAGVNEDEVALFVQNDPKRPLLTDDPNDADDFCDHVDEEGAANSIPLQPIAPKGKALPGQGTESQEPAAPQCSEFSKAEAVEPLCIGSELTTAVGHTMAGKPPVVFAVKVASSGVGCTGTSWDSQTVAGWTCVVARAWDKSRPDGKGNLGFSKPIRVCRKLKDSDCEGAKEGDILQPPKGFTCTDGCKLPEQVTWSGPSVLIYTK